MTTNEVPCDVNIHSQSIVYQQRPRGDQKRLLGFCVAVVKLNLIIPNYDMVFNQFFLEICILIFSFSFSSLAIGVYLDSCGGGIEYQFTESKTETLRLQYHLVSLSFCDQYFYSKVSYSAGLLSNIIIQSWVLFNIHLI